MTIPISLGEEFQVNTYTTGDQEQCSIAALSDGGFVVTWMSNGQDGSFEGIYGQCYFADGSANGSEFHISTQTTASQTYPSVAPLTGGGFVVTWMSYAQDGSEYGVYAQRYDSAGAPAGSEFRVNTTTASNQSWPTVAALVDGGFAVTWQSGVNGFRDIYLQRYDSSGGTVGGETRVVTSGGINPSYDETGPAIAGLVGGGYVVTWETQNADGSGWGIYARLYDAAGSGGTVFRATTYTSNDQLYPAATGLADGGFVLVWQSYNQDLGGYGIYAQRYTSSGATVGVEFRVNTTTVGNQMGPSVTTLDDGGYIITWMSDGQDGDGWGVYGQRYAADGTANGSEFIVNTEATGDQWYPVVAALTNGNFVLAWESEGQDGSGDGVYAQMYSSLEGNAIIFPAASGYDDWAMSTGSGVEPVTPPDPSDTFVVWPNDDGTVTCIIGTGFTYDEVEGTPTGGTVTTLEHRTSFGGTLLGQITGLSHSLVTGYSYLGSDDADALEGFLAFVLSGDDVIVSADTDDTELGGYAGDDHITAGAGSDVIEGGAGADTIDGGAHGLVGDTAYYFYSPAGVTVDLGTGIGSGGDAEGDQLSNIENLVGSALGDTLTGDDGANILQGEGGNDTLRGGLGDDELSGGTGADTLDGGVGADTMTGGDGSDLYYVNDTGDLVIETTVNVAIGGTDRVIADVTYTLPVNVENLTMVGYLPVVGNGNGSSNFMSGNAQANTLRAWGGNDVFLPGLGNDWISGGIGQDYFVFNTALGPNNRDGITDFVHVDDTIRLENAIFTGVGAATGTLSAAMFYAGTAAHDADDRIIYNAANGQILYDADGLGGSAAVLFATLTTKPQDVDHTDFVII